MAYDVKIVQQPPCGLVNLRGAAMVCQRYAEVLGFELPCTPNTTSGNEHVTAMWLGPDEWLLRTDDGAGTALADALRGAAEGHHAAVTVVSDAYLIFTVSGKEAAAVLNQGTGMDLHPRSFTTGTCVRTSLGKMGVILHQVDDTPSYHVYAWRSYGGYFAKWLDKAAGVNPGS